MTALASLKFSIGDQVYYASRDSKPKYLKCPDCLGQRYIRAIIADGTEYAIDCAACSHGYNGSDGLLHTWELSGYALSSEITGLTIEGDKVLYTGRGFYQAGEDEVFATEAEAQVRADAIAQERTEAEHARLLTKEKDTHTWAWHVTYHRRCIKQAEKDLAYHTAKLDLSKFKAKEATR